MRTAIYIVSRSVAVGVFLANLRRNNLLRPSRANHAEAGFVRRKIRYLKVVNSVATADEIHSAFLLMAQYFECEKRLGEWCRVLSARLEGMDRGLTDAQKRAI